MMKQHEVAITAGKATLAGSLSVPPGAGAIVAFAHGSGSGRHSPRNRHVASVLQQAGMATLLMDLLTAEEEAIDLQTGRFRFDIALLGARVVAATDWLRSREETAQMALGWFGASTGAAAALVGAAERPDDVAAVVSRGGRPDLAARSLPLVKAPTLLIVGGDDVAVIGMNEDAMAQMRCKVEMKILPGAGHLFEEPGALDEVARMTLDWFALHLLRGG
jgi:putative phosphoribosyl transferase